MIMRLKNRTERENFIKNYGKWGVWKEIPELKLKYYRYMLPNGAYIIITEYSISIPYRQTTQENIKYHLLLSKTDEYRDNYGQCYTDFDPDGCSLNKIVDYLTKNRHLEVEMEI